MRQDPYSRVYGQNLRYGKIRVSENHYPGIFYAMFEGISPGQK